MRKVSRQRNGEVPMGKHYPIKMYGGMVAKLRIINFGIRWRYVMRLLFRPLYPRERSADTIYVGWESTQPASKMSYTFSKQKMGKKKKKL
jgi:hypothetical protein